MVSSGYANDLLVVAPAGSYRNWCVDKSNEQPSELRRHLDPRLLKILRVACWSGKKIARDEVRRLVKSADDHPRALFVNVEAISTSEEVTELCAEFLRAGRCLMAVDESTVIRGAPKIKRTGSIRTKRVVLDLGPLAKARRILTGLITPKSPLDLYWQFYFLDKRILGHDSYVTFRARYAKVKRSCFEPSEIIRGQLRRAMGLKTPGASDSFLRNRLRVACAVSAEFREAESGCRVAPRKIPDNTTRREMLDELSIFADGMSRDMAVECILRMGSWIRSTIQVAKGKDGAPQFQRLEELQALIAPFSYRVLKSDCMDLPPKVYQTRDVELTPEQRRMYDEILRHATTELEGQHVVAKTVIAQMLRLHQVALGHCADNERHVFDVPSNRIDALIEVLEDHDGPAIIWSHYRFELDKIVWRLRKHFGPRSVAQFHGGNRGERDEEERRFLGGDAECDYMVSTQSAGGKGNTWVAQAREVGRRPIGLMVYCSNSFDLEHRLQSEDRAHRRGQTGGLTLVDLIARGTVEERIVRALRQKIDLASAVTGEGWREWLV